MTDRTQPTYLTAKNQNCSGAWSVYTLSSSNAMPIHKNNALIKWLADGNAG